MLSISDPSHCKVALLAGGTSGEREISLNSGRGASKALKEAGFNVTQLDPAKKDDLIRLITEGFDIAFLCLHGKGGEDGALQGFLETIGLPYVGSGVLASATAIDKGKAKIIYDQAGLKTPPSVTVKREEMFHVKQIAEIVGERSVVKAPTEGSTLGIYMVESSDDLEEAIDKVFEIDDQALIEKYVEGRELTVAVIGNDNPTALPIIEIIPQNEFYDYESKYAPGGSEHICPARLAEERAAEIRGLAELAHKSLGCSGVSRTDFILDSNNIPWVLETNTIPGMTETSLLPDAARAAGISFPELCMKLIGYASERFESK